MPVHRVSTLRGSPLRHVRAEPGTRRLSPRGRLKFKATIRPNYRPVISYRARETVTNATTACIYYRFVRASPPRRCPATTCREQRQGRLFDSGGLYFIREIEIPREGEQGVGRSRSREEEGNCADRAGRYYVGVTADESESGRSRDEGVGNGEGVPAIERAWLPPPRGRVKPTVERLCLSLVTA